MYVLKDFFTDYGMITLKLISAFGVVLVFLKVFGMKHQLKQMTSLDLILNFILSAILSGFILNEDLTPIGFFIVMVIYIALVYIIDTITRKTAWGRRIFIGIPRVIIEDGKMNEDVIDKMNLSVHDIAAALRDQHIHSLAEVKMAQIEPGGTLTIVKKGDQTYPVILIDNGVLDVDALESIRKTEKWLMKRLLEKKIKEIRNVFFAAWHKGRLEVIRKS
jgi:uncharacterized membrane protein YcaP (DUF421 family)